MNEGKVLVLEGTQQETSFAKKKGLLRVSIAWIQMRCAASRLL